MTYVKFSFTNPQQYFPIPRFSFIAGEDGLTPSALGMVYLGGHRFGPLERSGLAKGSPEALRRADALFTWDPLPWCQELF